MPDYEHLTDDELFGRGLNAVDTLKAAVESYRTARLEHAASGRSEATRVLLQRSHDDILESSEIIGRCKAELWRRNTDS